MADLSITADNVRILETTPEADVEVVQFGEACTPAQPVYLNSGKYYKAVSSSSAAAASTGVCLSHVSADDFGIIMKAPGKLNPGASPAPVIGERYYVSGTAGGMQPSADLGSGEYVTLVGICTAANELTLKLDASDTPLA